VIAAPRGGGATTPFWFGSELNTAGSLSADPSGSIIQLMRRVRQSALERIDLRIERHAAQTRVQRPRAAQDEVPDGWDQRRHIANTFALQLLPEANHADGGLAAGAARICGIRLAVAIGVALEFADPVERVGVRRDQVVRLRGMRNADA
jgi:hypothetical protein